MTIGRKMDAAWKKAISDGKKKLNNTSITKAAVIGGLTPGATLAGGLGLAGLVKGLAKGNIKDAASAVKLMPRNALIGTAKLGIPGAVVGAVGKASYDNHRKNNTIFAKVKRAAKNVTGG